MEEASCIACKNLNYKWYVHHEIQYSNSSINYKCVAKFKELKKVCVKCTKLPQIEKPHA